jgi:hypothetical protein
MKRIVVVGVLVFLGVATWHIAESLSSDAIGMALGVIFGVLAGLPAALVTFAAGRRRAQYDDGFDAPRVRGDGPLLLRSTAAGDHRDGRRSASTEPASWRTIQRPIRRGTHVGGDKLVHRAQ